MDDLDGVSHVAYGACRHGTPIGVARYVRMRRQPRAAEIALTVADQWQRQGVGALLLRRLATHACAHGIIILQASALEELAAPPTMMRALGPTTVRRSWGWLDLRTELGETERG